MNGTLKKEIEEIRRRETRTDDGQQGRRKKISPSYCESYFHNREEKAKTSQTQKDGRARARAG